MFELIRTYQLNIMLGLSAACLTIVFLLLVTRFMSKRRKALLFLIELVATFLLYFDRLAYVYSGDLSQKGYVMVRVSNFFVFFLTAAVVLGFDLFAVDLLLQEGAVTKVPARLKAVAVAAVVEMVLVVISQFIDLFYYFDEHNVYHRGPGFLICYLVPTIGPLIVFTVVLQYRKALSKFIFIALTIYIFGPTIAGLVQIFTYGLSIVNMVMVLVSILLYMFTYLDINDEIERAHRIELQNLQEERKDLKEVFDQTANAFVMAMEKKDPTTRGRSSRIADITRHIARASGRTEEECDSIYYAALLHDFGVEELPEKFRVNSGEGNGISDSEIEKMFNVASFYDDLITGGGTKNKLPEAIAREELIKAEGVTLDAAYTQTLLQLIDTGVMGKKAKEEPLETAISCGEYRSAVTKGILITADIKKIRFRAASTAEKEGDFSGPSLILFDSYDKRIHSNPNAIEAYSYLEYAELWFDGHYVSSNARNIVADSFVTVLGGFDRYEVTVSHFEDHLKLVLQSPDRTTEVTVALPDRTKAAYVAITGENCDITGIEVTGTSEKVKEGDITRIAEEVSFIDRIESDIPNVQVDRNRSASTQGVPVKNGMQLLFHSESLPTASLVWHCPYIVLFTSEDGQVGGKDYREYALIKLNGEKNEDTELSENRFSMKKKEDFESWDSWKKACKAGSEFTVDFARKGNKITLYSRNLGIEIENTTIVKDEPSEIYAAITGDQVALTDIRMSC